MVALEIRKWTRFQAPLNTTPHPRPSTVTQTKEKNTPSENSGVSDVRLLMSAQERTDLTRPSSTRHSHSVTERNRFLTRGAAVSVGRVTIKTLSPSSQSRVGELVFKTLRLVMGALLECRHAAPSHQ